MRTFLPAGTILDGKGIVKGEVPRILGGGDHNKSDKQTR